MPISELPDRVSLEYLKKLAKDRLRDMRLSDPSARLAAAQLAIARDHGFPSWRALKAEVDRRTAPSIDAFCAACSTGDVVVIREMLDRDPALARQRNADGTTGLHLALTSPEAVALLLERGADPNARDVGDNALPLHFAAGGGPIESVRALIDAGSDVRGVGDLHELEVIGWATVFAGARRDVVDVLLDHGARHHIFSAIALGDLDLVRQVAEDDPHALERRLSKFEQQQSALHYVIAPPDGLVGGLFRTGEHYRMLALLIELGADLEATDAKGRTPLDIAMLRGDLEAMRPLRAAGAAVHGRDVRLETKLADIAPTIRCLRPMIGVPDIDATVAWYRAVGFEVGGTNSDGGKMNWASVHFGGAEIMFALSDDPWRGATTGLSLWMDTDRLDELYALLKERQLERARAALEGRETDIPDVPFASDLYTAFYGQREFAIRDPNGVTLTFCQPLA